MDAMVVHVTTVGGVTFNAAGVAGRTQLNLPQDAVEDCGSGHCVTIPAGRHKQIYVNYGPLLADNEVFSDERLAKPGTYALQISLYAAGPVDGPDVEVLTNSTTLTIEQPTGVDADVWQYLHTVAASGNMTIHDWISAGPAVARMLRSTFPSSRYTPWVATLGPASSHEEVVGQIDAALATNPPFSLRDNLLWLKGGYLAQLSKDELYAERDLDTALAFADRARAAYTTLEKIAASDSLRAHAVEGLSHLYTTATARGTLEQLVQDDPPAPLKLVPRVQCVSPGPGQTFSARFSYVNSNTANKVLQIGNLNEITPAPRAQGQPRVFQPGDHRDVFTASSPGGNLIWHLDGNTAVATADFAVRCDSAAP